MSPSLDNNTMVLHDQSTWSMTLSFQLVESLLECKFLTTEMQPLLNWLCCLLIFVMPVALLLQADWIFKWFPLGYHQASGKVWCKTAALVVPSYRGKFKFNKCWVNSVSQVDCQWLMLPPGKKKIHIWARRYLSPPHKNTSPVFCLLSRENSGWIFF